MNRSELEHVIRAASAITLQSHFVIIGSQAVLGEHPDAPKELLASMEADLYPRDRPEDSVLIDGAIGEGSVFHATFGYYAHGVSTETASLPEGWEERLVPVQNAQTKDATGWCLETHDLGVSKLIAGREKDVAFVNVLVTHGLADPSLLGDRLSTAPVDPRIREVGRRTLEKIQRS